MSCHHVVCYLSCDLLIEPVKIICTWKIVLHHSKAIKHVCSLENKILLAEMVAAYLHLLGCKLSAPKLIIAGCISCQAFDAAALTTSVALFSWGGGVKGVLICLAPFFVNLFSCNFLSLRVVLLG